MGDDAIFYSLSHSCGDAFFPIVVSPHVCRPIPLQRQYDIVCLALCDGARLHGLAQRLGGVARYRFREGQDPGIFQYKNLGAVQNL